MDSEAMITATKNEILQPQDWVFPVPIAYGPGRLTEIGSKAAFQFLESVEVKHEPCCQVTVMGTRNRYLFQ